MPSRSSEDRDFVSVARRVVEQAMGEQLDGTRPVDPDAGKNPAAVVEELVSLLPESMAKKRGSYKPRQK